MHLNEKQRVIHCVMFSRNMWNVWRTVLEENEKLARARLAAVEVFHQQIADDAKVLKAHKVQTARKVEDIYSSSGTQVMSSVLVVSDLTVRCYLYMQKEGQAGKFKFVHSFH